MGKMKRQKAMRVKTRSGHVLEFAPLPELKAGRVHEQRGPNIHLVARQPRRIAAQEPAEGIGEVSWETPADRHASGKEECDPAKLHPLQYVPGWMLCEECGGVQGGAKEEPDEQERWWAEIDPVMRAKYQAYAAEIIEGLIRDMRKANGGGGFVSTPANKRQERAK